MIIIGAGAQLHHGKGDREISGETCGYVPAMRVDRYVAPFGPLKLPHGYFVWTSKTRLILTFRCQFVIRNYRYNERCRVDYVIGFGSV